MNVREVDYRGLAEEAKKEIGQLNIDAKAQDKLNQVVDAYQSLQEERNYQSWNNYSDFALVLEGMSSELYHSFQRVVQKLHLSPGRAITLLMQYVLDQGSVEIGDDFLQQFKIPMGPTIQHYKELIVNAKDLKEIEVISFQHIKKLEFANDISDDLFSSRIGMIQHCNTVVLPENLNKLTVLTKTQHCRNFQFTMEQAAIV